MVILEVRDLDQSIVMSAMIYELLKNDLKKSLIKIFSQNYPDMLVCAEKYARTEEIFAKETPVGSVVAGRISTLQGGKGEPVSALDFHSKGKKMGTLRIVNLKILKEGIDKPHSEVLY